jgi:DNA ligase-associated metallophosphoesterase
VRQTATTSVATDTSGMRRLGDLALAIAGAELVATAEGALVWPQERLLAVADLHLEKGSAYARRRVFLPPYDSAATIARLASLVLRLAPRRIIFLGDSFHDRRGAARLAPTDRDALNHVLARREVVWITGNHDPEPHDLPGDSAASLAVGAVTFRHQPSPGAAPGEIAGHLHPVARIAARGQAYRRRCFAGDGLRAVMPAFGAYAGGLNVRDQAFAPLFPKGFTAHLMGDARVFAFPRARCLAD